MVLTSDYGKVVLSQDMCKSVRYRNKYLSIIALFFSLISNCIAKLFELSSKIKSLDLFSRILCMLHASLYLFKMSALLYMNMTCGQKIFDAGVLCMANIYVGRGARKYFVHRGLALILICLKMLGP